MIWFFTPYSFEKKLFEAYDSYMQLISNPEDWGCLCDGDMAFLISDFGNHIQEYIDKYPLTGLFVCYASRSPYGHQMKPGINPESDSIRYIFENTLKMYKENHVLMIEQHQQICAPLLVIQKKTWDIYRNAISEHARSANIQAIDTAISDILQKNNEKVLLMAGLQVFHYFRQYSRTEKHILSDKLTVVIRTHSRPKMFKRCIESVRNQTHKNIDIVVGVDNEESWEYAESYHPSHLIRVQSRERTSQTDFPANEYISKLIENITDGYILVLDDDAFLADPSGVEKLFREIDKEWCLYIMRYRHPNGKLFPNDALFASKTIQDGGIDWGSFVFHARFAKLTKSKPLYNGDYHFIHDLNKTVRVTKWINLALVHTDTPGLNGLTEKEMEPKVPEEPIQLITSPGNVDVVYVLGSGSAWNNNELRFSLRSIEKYGRNVGNIFIVGAKPDFLSDRVIHIAAEDIYNPMVNADGNIVHKVLLACADDRVSEDFLFINDDHILLKPVDLKTIPAYHKGDLNFYDPTYFELNYWRSRLKRTRNMLNSKGMTAYHFDCHMPMIFNKIDFANIIQLFPVGEGIGLTVKSIYGNCILSSKWRLLENQKKVVFAPMSDVQLTERLKDCQFMAFNDSGLNKALKIWLYNRFPNLSVYETSNLMDKHIEILQWLDSDRNYRAGVKLFEKYMHGSNLYGIFNSGENESLRKKLEYKLKQSVTE